MKRLFLSLVFSFFLIAAFAQLQPAPKSAGKAQKAILSLNTYDKNGDLMKSGVAFFIGQNGEAMADYSFFKGASKAIVIDMSGKQYDVDCIQGADDTYSVVRFRVNTKGNAFLNTPKYIQGLGQSVYALGFSKDKVKTCPQGTIESLDSIFSKYAYYKLSSDFGDEYLGAPLLNDNGEVVGILHSALGKGTDRRSYALDTRFREELNISAIQSRSASIALAGIDIEKGLPDTQEECLVYAYFKSRTAGNDEYMAILNRFVATYPQCAEAYYRRATPLTDLQRFDEADADLQKYLSLASDKADANFNIAQAIYNKLRYMPEVPYEKWTEDLALDYVNKAIELENAKPDDESPRQLLKYNEQKALIYSSKKDYDAAVKLYEEINVGENRSPVYYYAMSIAKEARGDSASTLIADLDSAVAMFGEPIPADAANFVLRRGQLYKACGQYRKAVQDYNTYSYVLDSKVSDVFYYDRSQLEMDAHMFQQAIDDIESACNLAPNNPLYFIEKSGMCLRFNMIDESIDAATRALALNDKLTDAYRIRGYAYVQKNNMALARADLQKAIDLGDKSAEELMKTYVK